MRGHDTGRCQAVYGAVNAWQRAGSPEATSTGPLVPRTRDRSALLEDADEVAGGIADGAVADPVRLLDRLLDDLGLTGLQLGERVIQIAGGEDDDRVSPFRHHLGDRAALIVGDAGVGGRRRQHDGHAGLTGGADGDPAHPAVTDVAPHLEAERVTVKGQRHFRIHVREERLVNRDVHDAHARSGSRAGARRFLIGLVTCFSTHDGSPAAACAARCRYVLGGIPTSSVNLVLKVPSDEQPTSKQTSVTLRSPRRSSAIARSIRRVIRYPYGDSP